MQVGRQAGDDGHRCRQEGSHSGGRPRGGGREAIRQGGEDPRGGNGGLHCKWSEVGGHGGWFHAFELFFFARYEKCRGSSMLLISLQGGGGGAVRLVGCDGGSVLLKIMFGVRWSHACFEKEGSFCFRA